MNRRIMGAAVAAIAVLTSPAGADEYPDPLLCGHRITTAYVSGEHLACHLRFGRKGHITEAQCAKDRPMKIIGGKLGLTGMGEVKGTLTIRGPRGPAGWGVRGYLSFTGTFTAAMTTIGDWRLMGLTGTARIRATCGGMETVFEVAP